MAPSIASNRVSVSRTLLIAEANRFLRAACARYFRAHFQHVLECDSVAGIDAALARLSVTDLICGRFLDDGWDVTDAVRKWKAQQPQLSKVVLLTGSLATMSCEGVDLVISKPFEPRALVEFFFHERRGVGVRKDSFPRLEANQTIGDRE